MQRHAATAISPLKDLLRCLMCRKPLALAGVSDQPGYPDLGLDGVLACSSCGAKFPLIAGTPRMLEPRLQAGLRAIYPRSAHVLDAAGVPTEDIVGSDVKERTARSFGYEWQRFGQMRPEWRQNFMDYMRPHGVDFFRGKLVLDIGTGSGRHSFYAAQFGAQVVALDLGHAIDVARRNLPPEVLTVQADAERLPFDDDTFDFVMSIGVLHHLPNPDRALRSIVPHARRGGRVRVYLYWVPSWRWHRRALRIVETIRHATVRMPHPALLALCYPLAAVIHVAVVRPYRLMRSKPRLRKYAEALPLKAYADYPFGVLVNDQFDRLSAPIERRFTSREVTAMLEGSGLATVEVHSNHGWVAEGVRPELAATQRSEEEKPSARK